MSDLQNNSKHFLEQQLKLLDNILAESCIENMRVPGVSIFDLKFPDTIMLILERLLHIWIADLHHKRMAYSEADIEAKVLSLYEYLNILPYIFTNPYHSLKQNIGNHSLRLFGDSDGADKLAAARYPEELSAIIEKGKYKNEQIFNLDDISFFWKKLPSHTNLVGDENSCHGSGSFKTSNEQLTILLGGNVAGDCKLKPLVVCPSQYAQSFDGLPKNILPVTVNKLAWLTNTILEKWLVNIFYPATECYCQAKGLDHNILLILDNAPGHKINNIHENVQVTYIPPNTAPLLQPMDQGIFTIFKGNYIRQIFQEAIKATSLGNGSSLEEYWKNYSIKNALVNINNAWDELTPSVMRGVWKHVLPQRGGYDNDFKLDSNLNEIAKNIVALGHKIGFDKELDSENVLECINWNTIELDNEALVDMITCQGDKGPSELTIQQLKQIISVAEKFTRFLAVDPNKERSSLVTNAVNDSIRCYRDLCEKKKIERSNQK